jgi:4-aminobutyrate aminotransferase-like enzyme
MRRRPVLSQREGLRAFGLDVAYERAEGSRLWYREPCERPVWDFLGGYGSTFFGHNHPALAKAAALFLERKGVVHAQASVCPDSDRLAAMLAGRLRESVGGRRRTTRGRGARGAARRARGTGRSGCGPLHGGAIRAIARLVAFGDGAPSGTRH